MKRFLHLAGFSITALLTAGLGFVTQSSQAGSATWQATPGSGDWNTATNWTPATIPNAAADTATFGFSSITAISLSADTEVSGIVFSAGASSYSIAPRISPSTTLTISGAGITNNSGIAQNLVTGVFYNGVFLDRSTILFNNNATAGSNTVLTVNGSDENFAATSLQFHDNANAGSATVFNKLFPLSSGGEARGDIEFFDNASAANASFVSAGSDLVDSYGALLSFDDTSTAGQANIVLEGGAASGTYTGAGVDFRDSSSAGAATFTINGGTVSGAGGAFVQFETTNNEVANPASATFFVNGGTNGGLGGRLYFFGKVVGVSPRVILSRNGSFDVSVHTTNTPAQVGSLEGNGVVFLGATTLTVNGKRSTTFSGRIQDTGGINTLTGGRLTKSGTGRLTLTRGNGYTGKTTISGGELLANNTSGSATGSGTVTITRGVLGGTGKISGSVTFPETLGNLEPGRAPGLVGTLTLLSKLTFIKDSNYNCDIDTAAASADQVVANGIELGGASHLFLFPTGTTSLPLGTVFTVLNNVSADPIGHEFANMPDGSVVTAGVNRFQANYFGGDGNDLILTVVP